MHTQAHKFMFIMITICLGGRGLLRQLYNHNWNLDQFREFAKDYPPNNESNTEIAFGSSLRPTEFGEDSYFNSRYIGAFVPPWNGTYTFYIKSDDSSRFYLSPNMSAEHAELIAYAEQFTRNRWDHFPTQISDPIELEGGKPCYLEVLHTQGIFNWNIGFGAKYHNTNLTSSQAHGEHEEQNIVLAAEIKKETQVRTHHLYFTIKHSIVTMKIILLFVTDFRLVIS